MNTPLAKAGGFRVTTKSWERVGSRINLGASSPLTPTLSPQGEREIKRKERRGKSNCAT